MIYVASGKIVQLKGWRLSFPDFVLELPFQSARNTHLVIMVLRSDRFECSERIQLGRRFGKDFESDAITLNSLQLRYARWGRSLGLDQATSESPFRFPNTTTEENEQAEYEMGCIQETFQDAEKIALRYLKDPKAKREDLTVGEVSAITEPHAKKVLGMFKRHSMVHQKTVGNLKKTTWVRYHKDRFDDLIGTVCDHIDDLVELFPGVKRQQIRATEEEVAEVTAEDDQGLALNILRDEAAITDPMLKEAVSWTLSRDNSHDELE